MKRINQQGKNRNSISIQEGKQENVNELYRNIKVNDTKKKNQKNM
jgi:hypothetical protein